MLSSPPTELKRFMNRNEDINIIPLKDIKTKDLIRLLKQYPFKYLQQYNSVSESTIIEYHKRKICQLMRDKKLARAIAIQKKDKLIGLAILEKLPWEIEYFKISMAKVSYLLCYTSRSQEAYRIKFELFQEIYKLSSDIGIKHLCFEVDARDLTAIHAAESNAFKLMITQLVYLRNKENLIKTGELARSYVIRPFRKEDISQILKIAMESKAVSRFHADERLPEEKRRAYYKVKTKNCCLGKIADGTFVLEKDKHVIGFYIFRYDKEIKGLSMGYVEYVALASEAQSKGIGTAFMREVDERLLNNVDVLIGKTHIANIPMIRTMNKGNAEIICAIYTFHKWI